MDQSMLRRLFSASWVVALIVPPTYLIVADDPLDEPVNFVLAFLPFVIAFTATFIVQPFDTPSLWFARLMRWLSRTAWIFAVAMICMMATGVALNPPMDRTYDYSKCPPEHQDNSTSEYLQHQNLPRWLRESDCAEMISEQVNYQGAISKIGGFILTAFLIASAIQVTLFAIRKLCFRP